MERCKKIIQYTCIVCLLLGLSLQTSSQTVMQQATKAYEEGDYQQAIELLENEKKIQKEKGLESSDLYYNLGNAYFRDNEIAKAILNYERALLIDPGDKDTRINLEFARTKIEDKIVGVDTFFLQSWFDSIQNLQSSDTWAKFGIIIFLLLIICLGLFFFTRSVTVKKVSFYVGLSCFVLLIFANVFSYRQKTRILKRDRAIIMVGSASITNSPTPNSKELFILHAGTKVKITKTDGDWMEIEIDNGSVGWVNRSKLEII